MIHLRDVTAGYGRSPAVRGVSLKVDAGEVVGLIGPNGSGKTTLVRVASRALRPASGRVLVAGEDPYSIPARRAARLVAVVPQEVSAAFGFTALEVILMGRAPYMPRWGGGGAEDYRRAREAAERVLVHHLLERTLDRLSGGERQRVILAQALAQDAPVLLLDEPTAHLDPKHVVGILGIARDLAAAGRAVLAVFHDLNLAAAWCDRLVALHAGAVVADGTPEQVVTPALMGGVYGVAADVAANPASGRPTVLLAPAAPLRADGAGSLLPRAHVVGGAGRGADAMRALAAAGYEVTAGVLHDADTDAVAAERLNLERIVVPAFSPVDGAAGAETLALMLASECVVLCDAPYGPGNLGNLRAVLAAADAGIRVIVVGRSGIEERDFTEGEATGLWRRIAARADAVGDAGELIRALRVR